MSKLEAETRVDYKRLAQYKGKVVRLTAKVIKLNGDAATVECCDGGQVAVHIPREMHIADTYVEIIGQVKDDLSIKALTSISLGNELDMKAVQAVVNFANSATGEGVF
ncbi:replication factor A3, partial [Tremellales sp. Uapishka_1]